jgi:hypothetical protein
MGFNSAFKGLIIEEILFAPFEIPLKMSGITNGDLKNMVNSLFDTHLNLERKK